MKSRRDVLCKPINQHLQPSTEIAHTDFLVNTRRNQHDPRRTQASLAETYRRLAGVRFVRHGVLPEVITDLLSNRSWGTVGSPERFTPSPIGSAKAIVYGRDGKLNDLRNRLVLTFFQLRVPAR